MTAVVRDGSMSSLILTHTLHLPGSWYPYYLIVSEKPLPSLYSPPPSQEPPSLYILLFLRPTPLVKCLQNLKKQGFLTLLAISLPFIKVKMKTSYSIILSS